MFSSIKATHRSATSLVTFNVLKYSENSLYESLLHHVETSSSKKSHGKSNFSNSSSEFLETKSLKSFCNKDSRFCSIIPYLWRIGVELSRFWIAAKNFFFTSTDTLSSNNEIVVNSSFKFYKCLIIFWQARCNTGGSMFLEWIKFFINSKSLFCNFLHGALHEVV